MKYKKRSDGFRSGFEAKVAEDLRRRKIPYEYESRAYSVVLPVPGHYCRECASKSVARMSTYHPDFHLKGGRLIVETKGRFTARDRKLAARFKIQHPHTNYRLLFQRNNTLTKASKTRYTDWCEKNNIPCAVGTSVPQEWLVS